MLQNPVLILLFLACIQAFVLGLNRHPRTQFLFKALPPIFWIYFLPMLAATAGILDPRHPLYSAIIRFVLPASLVLLLVPVDLKAILRLGRPALLMMLSGTAGILIATPAVLFLFKRWLPPDSWSGFGALSASWMGGSSNMIAVKEAIGTPDDIFAPMILVDTFVGYSWMGGLIALSGYQFWLDRWNRSDRTILEGLTEKISGMAVKDSSGFRGLETIVVLLFASASAYAIGKVAPFFPEIDNILSEFAWIIILVTTLGIGLSFTPVRKLEDLGATKTGGILIYYVITAIGAQASLAHMKDAFLYVGMGFLMVLVHGTILFLMWRWTKTPFFLFAAASQANIGGVVSAPIVAAVYQPGLAPVGLLLAIFGNISGTYLGILVSQICRFVLQ